MSSRCCLLFSLLLVLLFPSCQTAPPLGYAESAPVAQKRDVLYADLLLLLPEHQRAERAARQEARWLADTGYKASAAIARLYEPKLAGWLNNRLVNSRLNLQERGLCWHYQHDMFRELRRRKLVYFRVGCCVRDEGKGSEHHCVFLAAQQSAWPEAIILDAWRYSGRLKLIHQDEIVEDAWEDEADLTAHLGSIYGECHSFPVEHWARVKSGRKWNDYVYSWSPEGSSSRQGMLMHYRMYQGLKERGGKLTNY